MGATESGRWVDAQDLLAGDELLLRGGGRARVAAVRLEQRSCPVYNFAVDAHQNYAVGRGGWLVHNSHSVQKSFYELPATYKRAAGVEGTLTDSRWTYRIDTTNLKGPGKKAGDTGDLYHIHVYLKGKEEAVIQAFAKRADDAKALIVGSFYRYRHKNRELLRPSDLPEQVRIDLRRLVNNATRRVKHDVK